MFLELSFNSQADSKKMSGSRAASSWRYDHEDSQEMSLDELISDFQQSARQSKFKGNVSGSDVSPLRIASPPKRSKMKESNEKGRSFADRAHAVKQESVKRKSAKKAHLDDSSDDEGAVSPMPRIEQALKNKPTLIRKRRTAPTRQRASPIQRLKPDSRPPVLSSSSLSPTSLSPLTSSSAISSSLSATTPDEDSIDALIGKDIRDLNKLILTSSRGRQPGRKAIGTARSPTTDKMSNVIRQSTRFRREESKRSCSPLRLDIPKGKFRSTMLESPPPPPPPDDEKDNEEDSFAEEIRELKESRRKISIPAKAPEKETSKEEVKSEKSDICTPMALNIRNASNAISDLLFEALKPFEDRQQEEDKSTTEKEGFDGDTVIRNAMTAELQSATQTIVSQLDLTFADMTTRRKDDLKTEAEAAATLKEEEKREKEAADEKKKTEEKETKEREMEILRLIPMQGKLLTCSADIETVLTQLENTDSAMQDQLAASTSTIDEEVRALRSHTQRRIQEIEARMSVTLPRENQSNPSDGVSWRAVDWVQDNFTTALEQSSKQRPEVIENGDTEASPVESEGPFKEVLQRQVLEKLDLTILKLKHVLDIDMKEATEAKEKEQQEKEEEASKQKQRQLEDEQTQRELEDAENARRRVMGLTSVNEVEGWIEEGQQLRDALGHDRYLNRLMESLENRMKLEGFSKPTDLPPNQEEVLHHFDRLHSAMATQGSAENSYEEVFLERGSLRHDVGHANRPVRREMDISRVHESNQSRWIKVASSESDDNGEDSGSSDDSWQSGKIGRHRPIQRSYKNHHRKIRSPLGHLTSSSGNQLRRRLQDGEDFDNKKECAVRFSSKSKRSTRKSGSSGLQLDAIRTIQAFQAERRQKMSWIQKHSRRPFKQEAPFCNPFIL